MNWLLKWSSQLSSGMYYNLLERGFIKPEDMEPDITGFEFYFDAFNELNTSRPSGLDISPIPFTAIAEYFKMFEIEEDFDDFRYYIRILDGAFLEYHHNRNKEKDKNGNSNSNKKNSNKG